MVNVEQVAQTERSFLEHLGFTAMHNDSITFLPQHLQAVSYDPDFGHQDMALDPTLECISFLRMSDASPNGRNQQYHFLHLTNQEYFAARYFLKQWISKKQSEKAEHSPVDLGLGCLLVEKRRLEKDAGFCLGSTEKAADPVGGGAPGRGGSGQEPEAD
ncbi:hypothetical protein CDD83_10295 [Cordyceps sp. RAO-2017]|nr:hypothetical protein CDD83_10295 [Cordyceps sp. RAO-2017]